MRLCPGCREPVELGDLRYTGREPEETWHAHCWSDQKPEHTNMGDLRAQMVISIDKVERAFEGLRRRLEKHR